MADLHVPSMVTEACAVRCITTLMIECPNVTLFTMGKVTNKFVIRQDFVGHLILPYAFSAFATEIFANIRNSHIFVLLCLVKPLLLKHVTKFEE